MDNSGVTDLVGRNAVPNHSGEPTLRPFGIASLHTSVHEDVVANRGCLHTLRLHLHVPLLCTFNFALLGTCMNEGVEADGIRLKARLRDLLKQPLCLLIIVSLHGLGDGLIHAGQISSFLGHLLVRRLLGAHRCLPLGCTLTIDVSMRLFHRGCQLRSSLLPRCPALARHTSKDFSTNKHENDRNGRLNQKARAGLLPIGFHARK
mmetsp:Transcript_94730/g.203468  ORF Transcript_94730/g.203468 Transcript_94730/m.203468 type:complete len:205 (-) Transcript_94730:262-876(-)